MISFYKECIATVWCNIYYKKSDLKNEMVSALPDSALQATRSNCNRFFPLTHRLRPVEEIEADILAAYENIVKTLSDNEQTR
jgi:hypothetical protein